MIQGQSQEIDRAPAETTLPSAEKAAAAPHPGQEQTATPQPKERAAIDHLNEVDKASGPDAALKALAKDPPTKEEMRAKTAILKDLKNATPEQILDLADTTIHLDPQRMITALDQIAGGLPGSKLILIGRDGKDHPIPFDDPFPEKVSGITPYRTLSEKMADLQDAHDEKIAENSDTDPNDPEDPYNKARKTLAEALSAKLKNIADKKKNESGHSTPPISETPPAKQANGEQQQDNGQGALNQAVRGTTTEPYTRPPSNIAADALYEQLQLASSPQVEPAAAQTELPKAPEIKNPVAAESIKNHELTPQQQRIIDLGLIGASLAKANLSTENLNEVLVSLAQKSPEEIKNISEGLKSLRVSEDTQSSPLNFASAENQSTPAGEPKTPEHLQKEQQVRTMLEIGGKLSDLKLNPEQMQNTLELIAKNPDPAVAEITLTELKNLTPQLTPEQINQQQNEIQQKINAIEQKPKDKITPEDKQKLSVWQIILGILAITAAGGFMAVTNFSNQER